MVSDSPSVSPCPVCPPMFGWDIGLRSSSMGEAGGYLMTRGGIRGGGGGGGKEEGGREGGEEEGEKGGQLHSITIFFPDRDISGPGWW